MRIWDCDGKDMERRHSTASDSSTDSRQSSTEGGLEGGRITKTVAPKVAANPLQFVKVGPCDLYRSAQEQLKKVEEIKKAKKETKDEAEEWQSNLDNWKCSRRKRQEHIIERVVEVKKLELEEHERNRRRSKTFSEMMQERNTRGRKTSLPVWNDDSDDLSDLGISTKNDSSNEERTHEVNSNSEQESCKKEMNGESENCHTDNHDIISKERSKVTNETEEYTYERAIQSYVNFAETRVKSRSTKSLSENAKEAKNASPPIPTKPKRGSVTKIDTFINQIESNKNKQNGENNEQSKKPIALPKVSVNKRKELFEKVSEVEESNKVNKTADLPATKSIKERLSSLEKQKGIAEMSRSNINLPGNKNGVKERLSSIEKISSSTSSVPRRVSEPLSSQTIKERLSSFEKSKVSPTKTQSVVESTVSIKERLNSLHSSCEKEPAKTVLPSIDPSFNEKLSNFKGSVGSPTYQDRAFSPDEMYSKRDQHFRHRSLDSLDINQENMSNGSFERVQSLEDLDYRNYPASTFSGDTDREDSGIHTADVSSSVSQADDYDLHLDGNILDDVKMNHQPPIEEETKMLKVELNHADTLKNEPCEIQGRRNDFESELLKRAEPLSKYEDKTIPQINSQSTLGELSLYKVEQTGNKTSPYENIILNNVPIVNQLTEIVMESEPSCLFPLSSAVMEPPKEKPPPPPAENSDEETEKAPSKSKSLRRLDSTKRIKKELRQKRSSFLGLEGNDDDSYLEPELIRPPDMTTLLAEERRMERQLYRQSVCSESDSNQESRDSGVELDHKHHDVWSHSRNDSETFGNQSTTSDEDEIMKKEREIIETLEQEEKIRKQDLGEKLAMRLRELEAEKERWELLQAEEASRNAENHIYAKHNHASADNLDKCRSQEELEWCTPSSSLQDISHIEPPVLDYREEYRKSLGDLSQAAHRHQSNVRYAGHRRSMPNLQELAKRRPPPPPPPVLPSKSSQLGHQPHPVAHHVPVIPVPQQRILNSQVPNQPVQANGHNGSGQMTRQTLHALSAAPRSRLISNDSWQVRKKQTRPPDAYNYQHWLIQEAEHRRITEKHERMRRPEGSRQGGWPTSTPHIQQLQQQWGPPAKGKHLPEAIIQTLTQRVQSRLTDPNNNRRRPEATPPEVPYQMPQNDSAKDKMLSVSGKKRCSHCGDELGRGAAMIIESLQLFYHIDCFKCCVCCIQLGDGLNGTDVRVRNNKLHCHNCYSSDDGAKFSCV